MMLFTKRNIQISNPNTKFLFKAMLFLSIIGCFGLQSCDTNALYENNIHLESQAWNMQNQLSFDVDISDTTAAYDFYLNIRHNDDYKYSNLFLFVDTFYPSAQYTRDTIEILLANNAGQWFGEGFGDLKEIRVLLKQGVYFSTSGVYKFDFVHAMRSENLEGVEDFGIRIEKSN